MTTSELIEKRLHHQKLTASDFTKPAEVVAWLGAVQAQDFPMAKWSLGLRAPGLTDAAVEQAFNEGAILRTHILRPTWHFVTPEDIRWMLQLTAPRVHVANGSMYRKCGLDEAIFRRSHTVLEKALQGGKQLTRDEIGEEFQRAGIACTAEFQRTYLVMQAELEGVICSGGRRGKQFTYALLAERAPNAKTLPREEALAELTRRYFSSHGPATLHDFSWWSGLTLGEVKQGIASVQTEFAKKIFNGKEYWLPLAPTPGNDPSQTFFLLSLFDESVVAYKDRSALTHPRRAEKGEKVVDFMNHMVLGGQIAGMWKREVKRRGVVFEVEPCFDFGEEEERLLAAGKRRYEAFVGLEI